jgi:hypothetical protein
MTTKIKTTILKWLGLDDVINKLDNVSHDLYNKDWSNDIMPCIDYRELSRELDYGSIPISIREVANEFDTDDIAREVDHYSIASEIDIYDLASNIEMSDLAYSIDKDDLVSNIDMEDEVAKSLEVYFEGDKMNEFARIVADKIADRDGMQQLVSEEVENQGVNTISTDAVQSMIDTAIQQFADSLEVMVSAKLNINK